MNGYEAMRCDVSISHFQLEHITRRGTVVVKFLFGRRHNNVINILFEENQKKQKKKPTVFAGLGYGYRFNARLDGWLSF